MNYIQAVCRTNLDGYDCTRVTRFAALPREGDKVAVWKRGVNTTLRVCSVTHTQKQEDTPIIIVELHN